MEAIGYYTDKLPLFHYRCSVDNVPVCRPDLFPTSTSNQCDQEKPEVLTFLHNFYFFVYIVTYPFRFRILL